MGRMCESNYDDVLNTHEVTDKQVAAMEAVRAGAKVFARAIIDNVPPCADQQAALRKLREAMMTANNGIALEGEI